MEPFIQTVRQSVISRYLPLPHAAFLIEGIGPQGRLISISQSVTGSGMSI